jgi:hypothetical protein
MKTTALLLAAAPVLAQTVPLSDSRDVANLRPSASTLRGASKMSSSSSSSSSVLPEDAALRAACSGLTRTRRATTTGPRAISRTSRAPLTCSATATSPRPRTAPTRRRTRKTTPPTRARALPCGAPTPTAGHGHGCADDHPRGHHKTMTPNRATLHQQPYVSTEYLSRACTIFLYYYL